MRSGVRTCPKCAQPRPRADFRVPGQRHVTYTECKACRDANPRQCVTLPPRGSA